MILWDSNEPATPTGAWVYLAAAAALLLLIAIPLIGFAVAVSLVGGAPSADEEEDGQ